MKVLMIIKKRNSSPTAFSKLKRIRKIKPLAFPTRTQNFTLLERPSYLNEDLKVRTIPLRSCSLIVEGQLVKMTDKYLH